MIVLSTIPEPVVTVALRMARQVPRGRSQQDHLACVYANFGDFFRSWEEFLAKVQAYQGRLGR